MRSILYYPNISIEDGVWLRNAILYWDQVSSIVPDPDYTPILKNGIRLTDCECYRSVYPTDLFYSGYVHDFINELNQRLSRISHQRAYENKERQLIFKYPS